LLEGKGEWRSGKERIKVWKGKIEEERKRKKNFKEHTK